MYNTLMKIVVTGGHPAPAFAVIDELRKHKDVEIHFIGRQFAVDHGVAPSYEFKHIKALDIPFYHLQSGRLLRDYSISSLFSLVRLFSGIYDAFSLLTKIKPDVIMSFGGYIALPVCIAARLKKIHVITHEQTISPGLANKIIGRFAHRILISFPETMKYFDVSKTRVTGNPMRQNALKIVNQPIQINSKKPVLYVTGGSLGSHSINVHIERIIDELLKTFVVIHQVGNVEEYHDFERLQVLGKKDYHVVQHFASDEVGWVFHTADIIVSRGGANTTTELIYYKKPCVVIPLPWSGSNEQEQHAKLFSVSGAGEMFDQSHSSEELLEKILKVHENRQRYIKNFKLLKKYVHPHATKDIVSEILPS